MNLFTIDKLTKNKPELVEKLKSWKVIPEEPDYLCSKCGGSLSMGKNEQYREGYMWICKNDIFKRRKRMRCGSHISLRVGTIFERSKLSMLQILGFIHMWVHNVPINFIMRTVEISSHTAAEWSSFCRELLYCSSFHKQEVLGGEGIVVEVGESKFGQSKCNRSGIIEEQWVLGGYERSTGRVFLVAVEDRTPETLLPIIRKWIRPSTMIISDCSLPYDCFEKEGYKNFSSDHSQSNLEHYVHTNSIRSIWRAVKAAIPKPGYKKQQISGNLAKYSFQKRCKELNADPFIEFLKLAGELFNPMNPPVDSRPVFGQCELDDNDEEPDTEECTD